MTKFNLLYIVNKAWDAGKGIDIYFRDSYVFVCE